MQLGGWLLDTKTSMINPNADQFQRDSRSLQRRSKVMLTAVLVDGIDWVDVRVRDLSRSGALLEGEINIPAGRTVEIRRNEQAVSGEVVWCRSNRCGVKFASKIVIEDWAGASLPAATERPAGEAPDASTPSVIPSWLRAQPAAESLEDQLPRRIGEEIAFVQRLIDMVASDIGSNPLVAHRHSQSLQSCRLARKLLGELAQILTSDDRVSAAERIPTENLKKRLLR